LTSEQGKSNVAALGRDPALYRRPTLAEFLFSIQTILFVGRNDPQRRTNGRMSQRITKKQPAIVVAIGIGDSPFPTKASRGIERAPDKNKTFSRRKLIFYISASLVSNKYVSHMLDLIC
jgi:hypothetical protein